MTFCDLCFLSNAKLPRRFLFTISMCPRLFIISVEIVLAHIFQCFYFLICFFQLLSHFADCKEKQLSLNVCYILHAYGGQFSKKHRFSVLENWFLCRFISFFPMPQEKWKIYESSLYFYRDSFFVIFFAIIPHPYTPSLIHTHKHWFLFMFSSSHHHICVVAISVWSRVVFISLSCYSLLISKTDPCECFVCFSNLSPFKQSKFLDLIIPGQSNTIYIIRCIDITHELLSAIDETNRRARMKFSYHILTTFRNRMP